MCPDGCLAGAELKALLYGASWSVCGDGAEDFLARHPCDNVTATGVRQSARGVAACAWELYLCDGLTDGGDIAPIYLKKTQAERMREEKK